MLCWLIFYFSFNLLSLFTLAFNIDSNLLPLQDPKPKLCRADYGGRAALNRMTLPENNPTER